MLQVISKKSERRSPTIMERNQEQREHKKEKTLFIQDALRAHNIKDKWYIDSGCSSHMLGDRKKIINLKKNEGRLTFGDNGSSKIVGKGTLSFDNGRAKVEKVLCVENLNHNLLSVSHMCDQGNTLTFDSQECEIRKENLGKLAAKEIKSPKNLYILYEINGENVSWGR
jgi:hypothetical protein